MTPYQLDESANAPCTRTMVGLVGCAVAAAPVNKRPTDVRIAAKIFILSLLFLPSARDAGQLSAPDYIRRLDVHGRADVEFDTPYSAAKAGRLTHARNEAR